MYKSALILGFLLLLTPSFASAGTPACSAYGYTVVYVNGIFDTQPEAFKNKEALRSKLGPQYNGEPVTVQLGYNQSHLAGAGDLAQTAAQLFNGSISNFDLDTILMQVYPEVTTRKLVLVGHSQGAFYTNSMYDYLLAHGEPPEAVGVYNVASPAAYTAGHGKYINSSGDEWLALLRSLKFDVLPNNIDLVATSQGNYAGHSFVDDYLAQGSSQILADMSSEMSILQPTYATEKGDCFTPPVATFGYNTQLLAFAVADPSAVVLKAGTLATVHAGAVALDAATKLAVGALQLFSDSIVITSQPPSDAQTTAKTEKIIDTLYGSSLDKVSPRDKKELLGSGQGAAVALAIPKEGVVLGTSTEVETVAIATTTQILPKNILPDSSNGPVLGGGAGGGSTPTVAGATVAETVIDTPADPDPVVTTDTATSTSVVATTTISSSIIASQPDFSGTPVHYWHSDGTDGNYLIIDPNDSQPGFSIGILATATSTVVGVHIKAQYNTDGSLGNLPKIPFLFDETGAHTYACARQDFTGFAYSSAVDASTPPQNPIGPGDYNNEMVDMYFTCATGSGHEKIYANTPYRLYFYPVSAANVSDIYIAANASGTPFYEISNDGTY